MNSCPTHVSLFKSWSKVIDIKKPAVTLGCRWAVARAVLPLQVLDIETRDVVALTHQVRGADVGCDQEDPKSICGPYETGEIANILAVQHHTAMLEALCVGKASVGMLARLALGSESIGQ